MTQTKEHRLSTLNGILFCCLFAVTSYVIASLPWIKTLRLSPLVIAIVLGMVYGSTLRRNLPHEWTTGIRFVVKRVLRIAIVLYAFRLTLQQVSSVGLTAILLDIVIVIATLVLGSFIGMKVLKLDRDTAILISSGAAICGAAAVLATESVLKSEPHKAAVAILSVVLFGSIGMFLYPLMFHAGWLALDQFHYGIYAGATIHEVAQVVVAGTAISPQIGNIAVIVKMTRVMLLAPTLIVLGWFLTRNSTHSLSSKIKTIVPWFAVMFIAMVLFNSLQWLPPSWVNIINNVDTFLLTLAMAALGIETNLIKAAQLGVKPFYLALLLFAWLIIGGYLLSKLFF